MHRARRLFRGHSKESAVLGRRSQLRVTRHCLFLLDAVLTPAILTSGSITGSSSGSCSVAFSIFGVLAAWHSQSWLCSYPMFREPLKRAAGNVAQGGAPRSFPIAPEQRRDSLRCSVFKR